MIARELNYPVPAIIQKIDDNDAMILVADSNLHRPHISTYDFSRTLRNKMTAMKRKAGRKKRGEPARMSCKATQCWQRKWVSAQVS